MSTPLEPYKHALKNILHESPTLCQKGNLRRIVERNLPAAKFNQFSAKYLEVNNYEPLDAIDEFVNKWQTLKGYQGSTLEEFANILREQEFNWDAGNESYSVYLVRKKEVNFILSYDTNLSHTGQEKFTSFFRMVYT